MHPVIKLIIAGCAFTLSAAVSATPTPQRQKDLLYLLLQDCGSCHGMTLKGGLGPALLPANLAGKDENYLINTVLDGRPNTAMPPWKSELTRDDVIWLIHQLRKGINSDE